MIVPDVLQAEDFSMLGVSASNTVETWVGVLEMNTENYLCFGSDIKKFFFIFSNCAMIVTHNSSEHPSGFSMR